MARGKSAGRLRTKATAPDDGIEPFAHRPIILDLARDMEIVGQRPADPALDRREEIAARQPHEIGHGFLGRGRMPGTGEIVGDLLVAGIFAFEQHAVEIEDQCIYFHPRVPNNAVPTRT